MARLFTKQEICAYLAKKKVPFKPAFEFRKLVKLDSDRVLSESYYDEILINFWGYRLCLMSSSVEKNPNNAEIGKIYIEEKSREYIVRGIYKENISKGELPETIDLSNLPSKLYNKSMIEAILEFTSRKNQTIHPQARYTGPIFDPPTDYLKTMHDIDCSYSIEGCSLSRLTREEEDILLEILGGNKNIGMIDVKEISPSLYEGKTLKEIMRSEQEFNKQLDIFNFSPNKPQWDLVRILAHNKEDVYSEQVKQYELLIDGGLETCIAEGEVVCIEDERYKLKKRFDIYEKKSRTDFDIFLTVIGLRTVTNDLARYWSKLNAGKKTELDQFKYAETISSEIYEALDRAELKVHDSRTGLLREWDYNIANVEDVLYWSEIKRILDHLGIQVPDKPVFLEQYQEASTGNANEKNDLEGPYNRQQLEGILNEVVGKSSNVHDQLNCWEGHALIFLETFIVCSVCSIKQFAFLNCFLCFRRLLVEKARLHKNENEIINDVLNKYIELTEIFVIFFELKKNVQPKSPVEWMGFSDKYSTDIFIFGCNIGFEEPVKQKIKFHHFGLDWKMVGKAVSRGLTYSVQNAAQYLGEKLNGKLEARNVIELCMKNKFNAYVENEKYHLKGQDLSQTSRTVKDIKKGIDLKHIDTQYLYAYDGLIRLKKHPPECSCSSNMTLNQIHSGGVINIKKTMLFECSVADYILGGWYWFEMEQNFIGKEISINDLVFRVEELDAFLEEQLPAKSIPLKNKEKKKREYYLHTLIRKIYDSERDKSSKNIWEKLRVKVNEDFPREDFKGEYSMIQELTDWNSATANIFWVMQNGKEKKFTRKAFENLISKWTTAQS